MAAALERHDELIAEVTARHGGRVLKAKGEGDSTLTVFRRASDGLEAAAELAPGARRAGAGPARSGCACASPCTPARRTSAAATTSAPP